MLRSPAFEDRWEWGEEAEERYYETIQTSGRLSDFLQAFRSIIGPSDMMAYLVIMAPRLQELHRVLKPTGSIYLHCDPIASHYLKLLMDSIFDARNFKNEIVWKRTSSHGSPKRWGPVHDILLFYSKTESYCWNPIRQREKAVMGCFITFEEPSTPMTKEALSAGFYESVLRLEESKQQGEKYPRIQILTIAELLAGKKLQYPKHRVETFKQAQRVSKHGQVPMFGQEKQEEDEPS